LHCKFKKKFFSLKKDVNQLNRILDVVGFPPESLINQINADARTYLERNPKRPPRVNFSEYFQEINSPEGKQILN
jgi:hypothetical protein